MGVVSKIEIRSASITRKSLLELLASIAKEKTLIAPVRNSDLEDVNFLPVGDVAQICFDYDNTTTSPKEFFFPQSESMFTFAQASNESVEVKDASEQIVLFGVRSCDLKGIELLDKFYERCFEDDYYLSKRRKSVIISVGCSALNDQCFCRSTEAGPVLEEGFDVQLLSTGDDFAVWVGSERGLELFESYRGFFGPPTGVDLKEIAAQAKQHERKFDLRKVYSNLKEGTVNERLWEDIASRCQSCGLCLFLCPTCSCYSVVDWYTPLGEGRRTRQWDGCYFRGFTRMAGAYNPIGDREEMMKRKYHHKLVQQVDEFGMSGCTGCGRCNLVCVGNINWLENLVKIERGG